MKVIVPPSAAKEGVLRIWLHRVPDNSDTILAVRNGIGDKFPEVVGRAHIYGRGVGSTASEEYMILFRLPSPDSVGAVQAGEELELLFDTLDRGRVPATDLNVREIK